MEPDNLTIKLLQEIRDDARSAAREHREQFERMDQRFEVAARENREQFERMDQRFEVIETSLRDLAQQLVMLARGIKTALEHRTAVDNRLDSVERRLEALEKAAH